MNSIRQSIEQSLETVLFFEVPNALFTLRDLGIWDLIYEHCSYFSDQSLARLFDLYGFGVSRLAETYQGQFLCIEALPQSNINGAAAQLENNLLHMAGLVAAFANRYQSRVEQWRSTLAQLAQDERRVVVWGSGSKGITFLNILQTQTQISYVVDINPRKHDMYAAGTGQKIVPPEFLRDYKPDVIIIMNPIYQAEIQQIAQGLDLTPEFMNAS